MKREWWAAGLLAAASMVLALAGQNSQGGADLIYALTLPFAWAGAGLRALSLSGIAGNVLALLLYALLSLLPALPFLRKSWRPKDRFSRWLLIAMSAYLFFLLYLMVNPSMIPALFHSAIGGFEEALRVEKTMLCVFFYSLLIARWILGIMADTDRIPLQLRRLMVVLGAVMIVSVFYVNVAKVKGALAALPAAYGDTFPLGLGAPMAGVAESSPACDGFIAVLHFVKDSAPTLLLLFVLPMADQLLKSLEQNFFREENQRIAAAIAKRCRLVILVSLGGMLTMDAVQLLLLKSLASVHLSGEAPILVLTVSLAMLLLSRYLERSFAVYRENQMMI